MAVRSRESEYVGVDVADDDAFEKKDDENEDDRRNIDSAEIGHEPADRPERRLGDPKKELAGHSHHLVARVDDVEGDEPGQHGSRNQKPDIKLQCEKYDIEKGAH